MSVNELCKKLNIYIHPPTTPCIPSVCVAELEIIPDSKESQIAIEHALVKFQTEIHNVQDWLDLFLSQGWLAAWYIK